MAKGSATSEQHGEASWRGTNNGDGELAGLKLRNSMVQLVAKARLWLRGSGDNDSDGELTGLELRSSTAALAS